MNQKDRHQEVTPLQVVALVGVVASLILWLENRRLTGLLEDAAMDHLTGMYTRKQLMRRLKRLEMSERAMPLSVIYIDIDDLKPINDGFGHHAGDLHLKNVADIIEINIRPGDISGRVGGDEFLVALPNTGPDEAKIVADRLRRVCAESATDHPISISMGIATRYSSAIPIEQVIHDADERMYADKAARKASA